MTTTDHESRTLDEAGIRSQATKRSWICPGAGFAHVGSGTSAMATFFASLCFVPALAWFSFWPTAVSFWTVILVLVIASAFWIGELIAIKNVVSRASSPSFLVRGFVVSSCVLWLAIISVCVLHGASFGILQMAGTGMKPTLSHNDRLVYHKWLDRQSIEPGAVIVYKNSIDSGLGEPGSTFISRILAGPGDKISVRDGKYVVNGATGPPFDATVDYDIVLEVPASPETLTVPDDCYFVVQDASLHGLDSRVLSWVRVENIVSSRLWHFGGPEMGKPIE